MKHIGFTSFSSCFYNQVRSLSPTVSDTVGSAPPPKDGPGGIRASDLKAPSLNCLVVHPLDPPKIQNPKSKIRNPKSKIPQSKIQTFSAGFRGFWILDFGSLCSISLCEAPTAPNPGDFGFWISDFGFWILDFGFWILDFGFCILEPYVAILLVQFLDFGFWISDFGFWILDFGFRILDFGFWILVWGRFRGHFLDAT